MIVKNNDASFKWIFETQMKEGLICNNIDLHWGRRIIVANILVLLFSFSEVPDSILGFKLRQKLVQEGFDLLITTTTQGKAFETELKVAKEWTQLSRGSATLLQPSSVKMRKASREWIADQNMDHFDILRKLTDVHTSIGVLPEIAKMAAELKEVLKCGLVLLATSKIDASDDDGSMC